jgi:hypothetical protein
MMPSDTDDQSIAEQDKIQFAIDAELGRLNTTLKSEALRRFSRRIEYWDLLITILENRGSNLIGLNDIVLQCKSGTMHPHSLTRFLREQMSAGLIYAEEGDRRDKKVIRASEQLISDFLSLRRS